METPIQENPSIKKQMKMNKKSYSMQICVWIFWHIIIEHNIHAFNIHTTTKKIRCNKNTLLEELFLRIKLQRTLSSTITWMPQW